MQKCTVKTKVGGPGAGEGEGEREEGGEGINCEGEGRVGRGGGGGDHDFKGERGGSGRGEGKVCEMSGGVGDEVRDVLRDEAEESITLEYSSFYDLRFNIRYSFTSWLCSLVVAYHCNMYRSD